MLATNNRPSSEPRPARAFAYQLAVALIFCGVMAWAAPDLAAWLQPDTPVVAVQTSEQIPCPPPSEHETRLVYMNTTADGQIALRCGPLVGSRGTYPGARR